MKIGIIVPVYSNIPSALFQSIQMHTEHEISWYLFFHGNDQRLAEEFLTFGLKYRVFNYLYMINRGLSRSWNQGICDALFDGNEIILVINDDIEFIEEGFNVFISFLDQQDDYGLAFLHGIEPDNPYVPQNFACFAIGYEAIRKIGFFDENILPAYFEDNDYHLRANFAQIKPPILHPQALVKHGRSATMTRDKNFSDNMTQLVILNHEYMLKKWGGVLENDQSTHRYILPFNSDISLKIEYNKRDFPYGPNLDRSDLALFKKITNKQESICYFTDDSCIFCHVGEKKDGFIITTRCAGYLLFGPYCTLSLGNYELTLLGEWDEVADATLDICSNSGQKILYKTKLPQPDGKLIKIYFNLLESITTTEIRIEVSERDQFKIQGYRIKPLLLP